MLNQSRDDWELIVVSDASTDDTDDVVRSYNDSRVKLVRLPTNTGHPGTPRNEGIRQSRGRIVSYLDHDDLYEPLHLDTVIRALDRGPHELVAVAARFESDEAMPLGESSLLDLMWHAEIQALGPVFQPTQVAHTRHLLEGGGWTDSAYGLEDWHLWLTLARAGHTFTTIAQHTVRIIRSGSSRMHTIPIKWHVPVSRIPSRDVLDRAHAELTSVAFMEQMRQTNEEDALAWYHDLWKAGELVTPVTLDGSRPMMDWEAVSRLIRENQPPHALPPIRAIPREDGTFDVGIDLLTADRSHAEATYEVFQRRFGRKLAMVANVFEQAHLGTARG